VATLAVITVAIVAWAVTSAIAIAPLVMELLPVVAVILLIGVLAYVLYTAWTQNWGGIQEKTAEAWAFLEPILSGIAEWFKTYIPYAWSLMQQYWNTTIVPLFNDIVSTLEKNIPAAIEYLGLKWGEIQKQMTVVWDWISKHLLPLFRELGTFIGTEFAIMGQGFISIWEKISPVIGTVMVGVVKILKQEFGFLWDLMKAMGGWISLGLARDFEILTNFIDGVTDALGKMNDIIGQIVLPDWMGDFGMNLSAAGAGANAGGGASGIGPQLRVMPGIQMTYVDNATIRSGDTNEMVDKLGAAFAQFLKQAGLL
jgi:hypothetical protein